MGSIVPTRATTTLKVLNTPGESDFIVDTDGPDFQVPVNDGPTTLQDLPPVGGKGGDPGNDYPWQNVGQDSGLDPWGEYYRECTSFVAWALHSRNGFDMPFYANAINWGTDAENRGYQVNSTPALGAVAWETKLPFGHVAWVDAVSGSDVTIEEYNELGTGMYDQRTVPASDFQYIHFADLQPGQTPTPPVTDPPPPPPPPPSTYAETVGGPTHTWTNYSNAGGSPGTTIPSYETVQVTCRLVGFVVADGNPWWYQIASPQWNNAYYASADAFYNNGATSGSLLGTPFYDPNVPVCGDAPPPSTTAETVGGVTHTWTNYSNAGGSEGPEIANGQTVLVSCRVQGFAVADGDTWWYRIASSGWNNAYFASADAFYNDGQTTGSLYGTPFVDPNVPEC